MNLAAFGVICAREREAGRGDDLSSMNGLAEESPVLAWAMTVSMLALAGFPATVGFFGKIYLIEAAVDNGYGWLGAVIVLGSAMSLAYYLRVVAAIWSRSESRALTPGGRPVIAGGAGLRHPLALAVAAVCLVAVIFFGVFPQPLFDAAHDAGSALRSLV
jgi:NADH-quinone oxidoreductase subunit N